MNPVVFGLIVFAALAVGYILGYCAAKSGK